MLAVVASPAENAKVVPFSVTPGERTKLKAKSAAEPSPAKVSGTDSVSLPASARLSLTVICAMPTPSPALRFVPVRYTSVSSVSTIDSSAAAADPASVTNPPAGALSSTLSSSSGSSAAA